MVVGLCNQGRDFGPQNGDGDLKGLFVGGGWEQLGVQVYGGLAMIGWATVTTFVLNGLLWWLLGTRVRWLAIVVVLQVRVAHTGARGEPAVLCGGGSAGGEQVW